MHIRRHKADMMQRTYQLLLVLILNFVTSEAVSGTDQCKIEKIEILEVDQKISAFRFKPIYNLGDNICSGTVPGDLHVEWCNMETAITTICSVNQKYPCQISQAGKYWVLMDDRNMSECFSVPGLHVKPVLNMILRDTSVHLSIKPDERVKSWTLTGYQTSPQHNACPSKVRNQDLEFTVTEEGPEIQVSRNFSLDNCYCFTLKPNGYGIDLHYDTGFIKHPCRPFSTKPPPPRIAYVNQSGTITILSVVAVLLAGIMVSLLAVMLRGRHVKIESLGELQRVEGRRQDVLVIYAQEEGSSHLQQVKNVIGNLRSCGKSKIYDIHKHIDQEFFEDPNEWLRQRIEHGRILIILSPSLQQYLNVVFSSKQETNGMKQFLVYGLKMIIDKNDYSKVFVASFASEDFREDDEDFSKVITPGRRYTLPNHLEELKTNMLITESSAE